MDKPWMHEHDVPRLSAKLLDAHRHPVDRRLLVHEETDSVAPFFRGLGEFLRPRVRREESIAELGKAESPFLVRQPAYEA